jgi:hypothetical protein
MRRPFLIMGIAMIFLAGCSDAPPRRLQKTVKNVQHQSFVNWAYFDFEELELTDHYQFSDKKWCLTYLSGPDLSISSTWKKEDNRWVNIETRAYVRDCNWSH